MNFIRHSKSGIWHLLWLLAGVSSAWACKYNVRDVGFVDWDPVPYRLLALVNGQSQAAQTIRYTAAASFLEANVELVLREDPSAALQEEHGAEQLPALVLVGPDERALRIPLEGIEESEQAAIWEALESVVASPRRDALLKRVVEAYAVVLVNEGADVVENERARQAAANAVKRIEGLLDRLPKAIQAPPEVMVLGRDQASEERVLLWSLGVENQDEASVAVVYGRARRVGPVLQGPMITETGIYRALAVLGQDCECDLDRAWMTGPLLPVRWAGEQQAAVQRLAGFDAESPMIKTEISRIVARGPSSSARTAGLPSAGGGLDFDVLGYSEVSVEEMVEEPLPLSEQLGTGPDEESAAVPMQAVAAPPKASGTYARLGTMLVVAGIVVVCLGGGAFLIWRARRDSSF